MQYDTILTFNNAYCITNLTYTQGVASFIASRQTRFAGSVQISSLSRSVSYTCCM